MSAAFSGARQSAPPLGGLLGDALGLRATLFANAAGASLAFLGLLCPPVRKLDTMPTPLLAEAAPALGG